MKNLNRKHSQATLGVRRTGWLATLFASGFLAAGVALAAASVPPPHLKPAGGVLLEWKPEGLPNLPELFGRVGTGKDGRALIHSEPGKSTVIWVEQEGYLPLVTTPAPSTSQASRTLVRDPDRVFHARDAYGRDLAGAELKAFPLKTLSDPLALMRNIKAIQKEVSGDETGRVPLPAGSEHMAGVSSRRGARWRRSLPSTPFAW